MASRCKFSATCSSPFLGQGGEESMDWHFLHWSTTSLTTSIVMFGFTFLTRYKVLSFPKWCILCRAFRSSPTQHTRAMSFFSCSQAFFTLVCMSALFFCDGTNVIVISSPNFLIKTPSASSWCLISILAASFVLILLSLDTSDLIHDAIVAESILISTACSPHFKDRLMPFIVASSSATLMWMLSSFFRSQAASSAVTPISSKAPSVRLLASHHITPSWLLFMFHSLFTGSSFLTSAITSCIIHNTTWSILSTHRSVPVCLLIKLHAVHSHLTMG